MKLPAAVLALLFMHALGFAQAAQPQTRRSRFVPPEPRDGEGTATTLVPILIYHAIRPYVEADTPAVRRYIATPQTLEEEFAWLKENGYASITFDELVNHIQNGASLPPKPVIISFDDDWEGQYRYALPLLKKYGYTATFYIWVIVVGRNHHMSWNEIKELSRNGMQLGCHTITHPYLTRIRSDEVLQHELAGARQDIEAHAGVAVTTLAYPFGQYNERVVAAAKAAGFTSARSTWPGVVHSREGLYSLTGLIRTESEKSLEDSVQRYLAMARNGQAVLQHEGAETGPLSMEGVTGAGAGSPLTPPDLLAPLGPDPGPDVDLLLLKPPSRQPSQ
jgi:peptidoglycan/xylan/chitin deacetylase (PgdA/CDA1 family)